MIKPLESEPN